MPSAVDIITYIGVPMAVLGVMPVLYTCFSALITQYRVQRAARKNNLAITTRVGLLAGVVEVDFPRFTIHTISREERAYWKPNEKPSSIKGGTWTLLNWQTVVTGKAGYRIQHSDELRQPQAEISLGDLLTFLLDRGATPSAHGLQLLRIMGLQTPPSTPILMCGPKPVLVISTADESEGRLSLKLQWHEELVGRSADSLPPYWVRVSSRNVIGEERTSPSVRLFLGVNGLEDARLETSGARQSTCIVKEGSIDHLRPDPRFPDATVSLWFACATVAVCSQQEEQSGLFRFNVPTRIQTFARRDTIPHGVLVLLGMRDEEETPMHAERVRLRREKEMAQRHMELQEQGRRMQAMRNMTTAERSKSQMEDTMARMHKMTADRNQRAVEDLERKSDALASHRVGNRVVAEAALAWLVKSGHVREGPDGSGPVDLHTLAVSIVHSMIFDSTLASAVCSVLASWIGWVDLLMSDVHLDHLKNNQAEFCYAAVLVNQIAEYEFNGKVHPVARDLDECQRVWGKVYLG